MLKNIAFTLFTVMLIAVAVFLNTDQKEATEPPPQPSSGETAEETEQPPSTDEKQNTETPETVEELPEVGFKAPAFTLKGLDGKTYSTENLDKPLFINFWASWCPPCKAEAPDIVEAYEKYGDQVVFYAVNLTGQDSKSDALKFAEEYKFTFPIPLDTENELAFSYRVVAIPSSYFVNEDGIIVAKVIGQVTPEQLEKNFQKLTEGK